MQTNFSFFLCTHIRVRDMIREMKIKDKITKIIPRVFNPYAWNILAKCEYTGWDVGGRGVVSGSPGTLSLDPVTMLGAEPELKPKSLISYWRSLHTSPHKQRAFGLFTMSFLSHELIQNKPLRQSRNPQTHRTDEKVQVRRALEGHMANRTDPALQLSSKMPKPPALDLWWDWERKKITAHKSYTFLWTLRLL